MKFLITETHGPYRKGMIHEPKKENIHVWRGRSWAKPYKGEPKETATRGPTENAALAPWTLSTSPADYLERYGDDAPNSELARAHVEAED